MGRTVKLWDWHTRIYETSEEGNMAYEQADFGKSIHFDSRLLGSVGSAQHIQTGPTPMAGGGRPQLSLVPGVPEYVGDSQETLEDQWQERALCAQTDPEAFFPEKGGSTREAKRICLGCEVRDECLDYALAHDERFGIWGGLSERERRRIKRGII
jgi:WhiB family transcriptional regulator, redox-sensing transcriptional regulator